MKGMKFWKSGKKGEDLVHGTGGHQFPKYIINLQRPSIYVQCHVGAMTHPKINQSINQTIILSINQSVDQTIHQLVI